MIPGFAFADPAPTLGNLMAALPAFGVSFEFIDIAQHIAVVKDSDGRLTSLVLSGDESVTFGGGIGADSTDSLVDALRQLNYEVVGSEETAYLELWDRRITTPTLSALECL
jgi:hypothetical protein